MLGDNGLSACCGVGMNVYPSGEGRSVLICGRCGLACDPAVWVKCAGCYRFSTEEVCDECRKVCTLRLARKKWRV